jgi:hypothetical protein
MVEWTGRSAITNLTLASESVEDMAGALSDIHDEVAEALGASG